MQHWIMYFCTEKRPVERHRHTWEDNIKMDLQAVIWGTWNGLFWLWIATDGGLLSMW
jgi:hypothetical protein